MEPDETIEKTTYYNSSYRHGVDEKRRVQIPAKWRPSTAGVEFTLILWLGSSPDSTCLRVLPPRQMAQLMREIDTMPNGDEKTGLKRSIGSGSEQASLDKSGRICLPEAMARQAAITNEAVLVGLLDRFEIWSPERYDKIRAADAVLAQKAFKLIG